MKQVRYKVTVVVVFVFLILFTRIPLNRSSVYCASAMLHAVLCCHAENTVYKSIFRTCPGQLVDPLSVQLSTLNPVSSGFQGPASACHSTNRRVDHPPFNYGRRAPPQGWCADESTSQLIRLTVTVAISSSLGSPRAADGSRRRL
jgi:hypothetical protein